MHELAGLRGVCNHSFSCVGRPTDSRTRPCSHFASSQRVELGAHSQLLGCRQTGRWPTCGRRRMRTLGPARIPTRGRREPSWLMPKGTVSPSAAPTSSLTGAHLALSRRTRGLCSQTWSCMHTGLARLLSSSRTLAALPETWPRKTQHTGMLCRGPDLRRPHPAHRGNHLACPAVGIGAMFETRPR